MENLSKVKGSSLEKGLYNATLYYLLKIQQIMSKAYNQTIYKEEKFLVAHLNCA